MAEDFDLDSMFPEPERPPSPEPTFSVYNRERTSQTDWSEIKIRLVGSHPLWAHHLWNAALALATFLDENTSLYANLNVLELGAGGSLPSIVAANNGAARAVVTDYPDDSLIDNMQYNVDQNVVESRRPHAVVKGYIWGRPVESLLSELHAGEKFNLIILSDLIFNHSQHDALLSSCEQAISSKNACVLVFYTHHRPHLAHKDMEFFSKARERGWTCEEVITRKFPPMFPEDPGAEEVRGTVHGWKLVR